MVKDEEDWDGLQLNNEIEKFRVNILNRLTVTVLL